jgi:hypothetical protein
VQVQASQLEHRGGQARRDRFEALGVGRRRLRHLVVTELAVGQAPREVTHTAMMPGPAGAALANDRLTVSSPATGMPALETVNHHLKPNRATIT